MNEEEWRAAQALADAIIWAGTADVVDASMYKDVVTNLMPAIDKHMQGFVLMQVMRSIYDMTRINSDDVHQLMTKLDEATRPEGEENEQRS